MDDAQEWETKYGVPQLITLRARPDNVFFGLSILDSETPEEAYAKLVQYKPPEERDAYRWVLQEQFKKLMAL
jgi:hypothetical protein